MSTLQMLISTQKSTKTNNIPKQDFSIVYTFNPWQYLYRSWCILGILPTLLGGKQQAFWTAIVQQPAKAYPEMHYEHYRPKY